MKITVPAHFTQAFLSDIADYTNDNIPKELLGSPLSVCIEKVLPRHTPNQQGMYWASLREWGAELGYSGGESERFLHNVVLCEHFGTKKVMQIGGSHVGIPNMRSSHLTIQQYSELIETMDRMRAESYE